MPDKTKQKEEKKPLSLEATLYKKGVDTLTKLVGKETETRVQMGQDKDNVLQDLLRTVSTDPNRVLKELMEAEVPIPGSQEGLIGTIEGATKGKFVSPFAQRTQAMGLEDATTVLKNLLSIQETTQLGTKKVVEEEKAKEALGTAPIEGGVSEREAVIAGRGEGIKNIEKAKIEKIGEAQKTAPGTYRFLQQYGRSVAELRKFDPDIEKEGLGGKARRIKAVIATHADELPETKAFIIQLLPLANGMAREIEGGRVTDQDRQIYANAFASALGNPGVTNTRLASSSIISLLDKGAYMTPQLKQLAEMNDNMFNDILNQVLIEYPDLVEDIYGEGAEVIE